ncbi:DotU family type IV/VI secretion system protein [Limnoglobus roseus]|uniref:Type IV / VI secretion system DotU domain-containing protein n=1 Tax=Limnoglobus roseus TaxID=2598579 RepID=A0A5C1AMS1_9BACT|nr:DotU family type IV/VI secretion system protein [Limnoglobus roseus]QEL19437.1 hypothetical protein PX52LOC_06509 [Limnoglobus roseus]
MTPELWDVVRRVFITGLQLKERLDRGERPAIGPEQAVLRKLLFPGPAAETWPDFAGDAVDPGRAGGGPAFLGLRYALACWLDELFIVYTSWDATWTEVKLEAALYGTNDRAWRFWEQASIVEERPDSAILGVFLQCVALGFRGDYRNAPDRLNRWVDGTKDRVCRPAANWQPPPYLPPPSGVPPLAGREKLRRMALAAGWVLLLTLPVVAYLAVRQFGG